MPADDTSKVNQPGLPPFRAAGESARPNPSTPSPFAASQEKTTVNILLVSHDPACLAAVQNSVSRSVPVSFQLTHAPALSETLPLPGIDILLLDLDSSAPDAFAAFQQLQRRAPVLSVILLATHLDDTVAARAIAEGAQDCLLKSRIADDLSRAMRYAAGRKQADEALTRERLLLRALIDHLPSLVFFKDSAGRYVVSNKAHTAFLGVADESQIIGKTAADFFPPAIARIFRSDDQAIMQTGQPVVEREEPQQSGDSLTWYATTKVPLREPHGKVSGIVGIKQDITSRKQVEASLRKAEERYRSIFENAVEGIFQSTPAGRYLTVNPAFARILGYDSPAEVLALVTDIPRQVYVNPQDRERFTALLDAHGVVVGMEHEAWRKDRTKVWLSLNGRAIRDPDDQVRYFEGSVEDITERKRAEFEIRHLAAFPQHNPNPVYEFAPDGSLHYFNDAALSLAHALGASAPAAILPPDTAEIVKTCWAENRSRRRLETRHGHRTISWSFFPIAAVSTIHCYAGDVTEHKRDEHLLRINEERFRILAKATSDAVWDWDLTTDRVWWSEGFEHLFGYRPEEIEPTVDSWTRRIHPQDYDRIHLRIHQLLNGTSNSWAGEYRFLCNDGTYAYVLDRGYVIRNEEGRAIRMIGGMTDLSDRKATEEKLAQQAALLDHASDAIIVMDLQDRTIYWNRSSESLYGWTAVEAAGQSCCELIGLAREKFNSIRDEVLRLGHAYTELQKRTKDGRELLVETRWSLMHNALGQPQFILSINRDVTEKRKLEQHFLRAQRMESIGTLAGGIAHDLNNVLAPIMMGIELLKTEVRTEDGHHLLGTLSSSAERGAALIRQVLSFARGVQGERVKLSLKHIVSDIQTIAAETFPKTITFQTVTPADLWTVTGDATNIHQVILNLCVNARDAMPNGGTLAVRLENCLLDEQALRAHPGHHPGHYVRVEVADTGEGVPEDIRHKIFEPFFTTKETGKGTGLGLSTTLGIIKSHGGFISLQSELGKGSTFKICLPADPHAYEPAPASPSQARLPGGEDRLILVVDDEAAIRFLATRILRSGGYRVLLAENGQEGLATYRLRQHQIALVLTDMNMPCMDGPAFVTALREIDPQVKIIGMSGLGLDMCKHPALENSLQAFIPKPYTSEDLLKLVHQVLIPDNRTLPSHHEGVH